MNKIKRKCLICGKEFLVRKSYLENNKKRFGIETAKYCSKICYYKSPARKPNLGKFGKDSSGWKGGRLYERGYKMILCPDQSHPYGVMKGGNKKYIREHRYIMEQHIGRYLTPKEIIHHKDGNISNNDISNLFITTFSEHSRKHKQEYWDKTKCKGDKDDTKNE